MYNKAFNQLEKGNYKKSLEIYDYLLSKNYEIFHVLTYLIILYDQDCKYRGHSPESTIDDWLKVREGEEQNIFLFIDESNVVFNSVHVYELAVLKKYAEPLLRGIKRGKPEHLEADRMLRFLEFVMQTAYIKVLH